MFHHAFMDVYFYLPFFLSPPFTPYLLNSIFSSLYLQDDLLELKTSTGPLFAVDEFLRRPPLHDLPSRWTPPTPLGTLAIRFLSKGRPSTPSSLPVS